MGYGSYDHRRWDQLRSHIDHVVAMVNTYLNDQELQEEVSSPRSEASFVPPKPETAPNPPPTGAHAPITLAATAAAAAISRSTKRMSSECLDIDRISSGMPSTGTEESRLGHISMSP